MYDSPLVEKYRPTKLNNTFIAQNNKSFFNTILKNNIFPNILLYGPPGTGKTTTILNIIDDYLKQNGLLNKGLVLHYNASDDRGIDIIRKTIHNFINSKGILSTNNKFIILDEVDYMTSNAQRYLKKVIETGKNVVYCLICNYISKIIPSLQCEFILLEYNKLYNHIDILKNISTTEKLTYTKKELENICSYYITDIRSMINYLYNDTNIIFNDDIYKDILLQLHKDNIKEICLKYAITLNISIIKLLQLCLTKYIKESKIENEVILFVEKIFIYECEADYILYWWNHYNNMYNV